MQTKEKDEDKINDEIEGKDQYEEQIPGVEAGTGGAEGLAQDEDNDEEEEMDRDKNQGQYQDKDKKYLWPGSIKFILKSTLETCDSRNCGRSLVNIDQGQNCNLPS